MNEYYIARLTVPNMFYIWSNPRNGLKEFYKILHAWVSPILSIPGVRTASTGLNWGSLS